MVQQDDLARDAQAQPEVLAAAARVVGTVEAVEDFFLLVIGDAGTVVGNRDGEIFIQGFCTQADGSACRGIRESIVYEDRERLPDPFFVAEAGRERFHG